MNYIKTALNRGYQQYIAVIWLVTDGREDRQTDGHMMTANITLA